MHDLSKYSYTELKTGAKYWVGTRSPNSIERETIGYSTAWLHHKGRNKHHWEYWVDFSKQGVTAAKIHEETDMMLKDMLVHLSQSNLEETIMYIKETYLKKS